MASKRRSRKRPSSALAELTAEEIHARVRALTGEFGRAVAPELAAGAYVPREGDPYWHREYGVPNGSYRVAGADLVLRFADGWLDEVVLARPPDYGGPDVQIVP